MVEETQVKEYDTAGMAVYEIREAARVYAVQVTDNVGQMLRISGVVQYRETAHKEITPNGNANNIRSWTEKTYLISNGAKAYVGDWIVWNGSYIQVMGNKDFTEKYRVNV